MKSIARIFITIVLAFFVGIFSAYFHHVGDPVIGHTIMFIGGALCSQLWRLV